MSTQLTIEDFHNFPFIIKERTMVKLIVVTESLNPWIVDKKHIFNIKLVDDTEDNITEFLEGLKTIDTLNTFADVTIESFNECIIEAIKHYNIYKPLYGIHYIFNNSLNHK